MNTVAEAIRFSESENKIRAADLSSLLSRLDNKTKTLSLDCFDTILWRHTAAPLDVFFDLQHRPAFQALNYSPSLRMKGESQARQLMILKTGLSEVSLFDIYRATFPDLNKDQLSALTEDELAAEVEACYVFPPIIELMRDAKAKGLKIIIVSDTYFKEDQLRYLLASKLPSDVMASINKIICSCDYGRSKSNGLFVRLLDKLNMPANSILHLGDNEKADFDVPQKVGIKALHLVHHQQNIAELLRMQIQSGSFIDPSIRHSRGLSSPFKGVLAAAGTCIEKPESAIGYAALGQVMYSFGKFILGEAERLKGLGKNPKILFLMRDGYLPSLVCEAIVGKNVGYSVRISRFAALAASFRCQQDVDNYLADVLQSSRFDTICKQLLISDEMAKNIIYQAEKACNPCVKFTNLIHKKNTLDFIFKMSMAYCKRLQAHLKKQAQLEAGDTVLFVDLGYTGTAQIRLQPVFRSEMNVEIYGCYLISLPVPNWEASRKGLLDPSWCDHRTMLAIVNYIALLEQLCTSNDKSVVDFDEEGNPIFSQATVSKQQHAKLKDIQDECIRFVVNAEQFFQAANVQPTQNALRDAALCELSRFIFFPTENELHHMQSFQFDVNLGTQDILKVFDQDEGLKGLRRRGLFFMEKNLKSLRTNYPAELRSAALELSVMLMASQRFSLDFQKNDFSLRRESLTVIAIRSNEVTKFKLDATATHDGYFSLLIPMGVGDFQIGVILGDNYQWVQIESADLIKVSSLLGDTESQDTIDIMKNILLDQIIDKENGLLECLSLSSLLVVEPFENNTMGNIVFRLIFRPVVYRPKN